MANAATIKGFIEVTLEGYAVLIAIHNIIGITKQSGRAVITLKTSLGRFDPQSRVGVVAESYDIVLQRIREAQ